MLSQPDGPFINVAKLNLSKYAQRQNLAKVKGSLFIANYTFFLFYIYLINFEYLE